MSGHNNVNEEVIIIEKTLTNKRMDSLDYLRGFALIGILLVNILPLLSVADPQPGSIHAAINVILQLGVESRFMVIFSFLFGVGFTIFYSRAKEKGENSLVLFICRLLGLLIFGFIHSQFHPGEALLPYAIVGFLLIPFYRVNKKINLSLALVLLVAAGATGMKALLILPLFLLGLAVGQYGIFQHISKHMPRIIVVQRVTLVLTVIGLVVQYQLIPQNVPFSYMVIVDSEMTEAELNQIWHYTIAATIVGLLMSAWYVTTLMRLLQNRTAQKVLSPLKYYGRMALTNYLSQTMLVLLIGYGFGVKGNTDMLSAALMSVGIHTVLMLFSRWWLSRFTMGPLEWIWRLFTYRRMIPLKRQQQVG